MDKEKYTNWQFLPHHLTAEEINDPHSVLAGFFMYCSLPACREELKNWLHIAMASDECERPGDLLFFHEQL